MVKKSKSLIAREAHRSNAVILVFASERIDSGEDAIGYYATPCISIHTYILKFPWATRRLYAIVVIGIRLKAVYLISIWLRTSLQHYTWLGINFVAFTSRRKGTKITYAQIDFVQVGHGQCIDAPVMISRHKERPKRGEIGLRKEVLSPTSSATKGASLLSWSCQSTIVQ